MNTSTPDNQKPEISIIILAWKLIDNLENCLKSIEKSKNPPRYEVIIVNNGADEDSYCNVIDQNYNHSTLIQKISFPWMEKDPQRRSKDYRTVFSCTRFPGSLTAPGWKTLMSHSTAPRQCDT